MSTTKKISGKAMGYLILLGLVVLSWAIFKILSPHNFGSFGNMLNYFQASLIATGEVQGHWFRLPDLQIPLFPLLLRQKPKV